MDKVIVNHPHIEKLLKGDKKILKDLYEKLFPKVSLFVKRNGGQERDAEEVFQNALFQLICRAKINGVQIRSTFHGYLYKVCVNIWLQELQYREKKRLMGDTSIPLSENEKTVQTILNQEKWDLYHEKFEFLSENCKMLLKDFFNKVSYDQITKKFNYSTKNVAFQRIFKCKKRLIELIKNDVRYKNLT